MKVKLLFFFILISGIANAQAPNWQWAKNAGGTYYTLGNSVAADRSGNVYVTGYFHNSNLTFGSTTLVNVGLYDMYLVKYDNNGNILWAKSAGGTDYDHGQSVATDSSGNVYVTGYFDSPTITFGSIILTNAGSYDMFIVKYNKSGTVLWAQSAGGTNSDHGQGVAVDGSGNILLTGYFSSPSIIFGSTTLSNVSGGSADVFILKYDSSGNVIWAKAAGGAAYDYGKSIVADGSGNVFVTGYFQSSNLAFGSTILTNAGYDDMFIVKYDNGGNVLWAKGEGGADYDGGMSLTADCSGNVFVTGNFNSPTFALGSTTLTNAGPVGFSDMYIVKYDNSGNILWAKSVGGTNYDYGLSLASECNGNLYVTGSFQSFALTFGSTTLTNSSATYADMFIAKYDNSGTIIWAKSAGELSDDGSFSVAVDSGGNVFVAGFFEGSTIAFGNDTLTNAGIFDMFLAKLNGLTGVSGLAAQAHPINIFPNPTSGVFTIQSSDPSTPLRVTSVEIVNLLGEKVYLLDNRQLSIINSPLSIDLSSQPNGVYFLQITTDPSTGSGGIARKKIVINH